MLLARSYMTKRDPKIVSYTMSRIHSKDTSPELIVRRIVYRLGYRYRLHMKDLPGKPDLVFLRKKKVIFVHGCFWHQHESPHCRNSRVPESNTDYWIPKFLRNVARDRLNQTDLVNKGWEVLVVWECETKDNHVLEQRIRFFLGPTKRFP